MQTILGISNGRSDRRNAVGFKTTVQTLSDAWRWRQQRRLSADEADCSRHQVQTPKTNADRIQRVHVANDIQTPPRIYDYVAELRCAKSKQNRRSQFCWGNRGSLSFFSHTHNIHLYSPESQQQQVKKAPNTQQLKQTNKRENKLRSNRAD